MPETNTSQPGLPLADCGEAWQATPAGARILERQHQLIVHMISAWPRRHCSLVEIGCGTGRFLEIFWSAGFDVTGTDARRLCLDRAGERMGRRAALRVAPSDHLPFDDDDFDYAAVIGKPGYDPASGLHEAFRLARRGVLLVFFNRWSLFHLECALRSFSVSGVIRACGKVPAGIRDALNACRRAASADDVEASARSPSGSSGRGTMRGKNCGYCWSSPADMAAGMQAYINKRPDAFRSGLFLPSFCWREARGGVSRSGLLPFGAVAAYRLDISSFSGTTRKLITARIAPAVR